MVVDREIIRELQTLVKMEEVHCAPRSEVRTEVTPNLATQVKRKVLTQDLAVIELNRATFDQLVILSVMLSRYVKPWLEGRGLTRFR